MENIESPEAILKAALNLDDAIEDRDFESVASKFTEDCEIELLGISLTGKDGVRKWMRWQFNHISKIKFTPVIKMVSGSTFFEEYIAKAKLPDGEEIQSKQVVVLRFEGTLIGNLRLYFDRLDFAGSIARDVVSKAIVRELIKKSVEGLE